MRKITKIILTFFAIPIFAFSQKENSSISFIICKLTTKNFLAQKYKPEYKYFQNYKDKIGFGVKYTVAYSKRLALSPDIEIHFLENNLTKLNGYKYDFLLYNDLMLLRFKNKLDVNFNAGLGYSLYNISTYKKSIYQFKHTYKGVLFNTEFVTVYHYRQHFNISFAISNSFFKIFKNDEYIKDETISYNNDFMLFKLGLSYILPKKIK